MSIAAYLGKLAQGLSSQGILGPSKGGTGVSSPGASGNVLVSNGTAWVSQSGAAGPTGPTGPQGSNGTIGVDGATGPTGPTGADSTVAGPTGAVGPTGPAGTAASGGASFYTGDVVLSANTTQYTAPTWIPCQGQMFDTGTYPGLDTIYSTSGSYDGVATQLPQAVTVGTSTPITMNFAGYLAQGMSYHDPITGDYYYVDNSSNKILVVGRDSYGNYIQSPNSLMSGVNGYLTTSMTYVRMATSPDGQVLAITQSGVLHVFKRNSLATETSSGVRWVWVTTVPSANWIPGGPATAYYASNIYVSSDYWVCSPGGTYTTFGKVNLTTNSVDYVQPISQAGMSVGNWGRNFAFNPVNPNMAASVADTSTATIAFGLWMLTGTSWSFTAKTTLGSTRYNKVIWSADGNTIYIGRMLTNAGVEIYSVDATGLTTYVSTIAGSAQANYCANMAMSAGDTYLACTYIGSPYIQIFKRDSTTSRTYTLIGSPQNASQITSAMDVFFDPKFNILGATSYAAPYAPRFWIGATKTIVPIMSTNQYGSKLKYYIKTGS